MKKCEDCRWYEEDTNSGLQPCIKHPFVFKNRDGNCPSYKKKWWKIC